MLCYTIIIDTRVGVSLIENYKKIGTNTDPDPNSKTKT